MLTTTEQAFVNLYSRVFSEGTFENSFSGYMDAVNAVLNCDEFVELCLAIETPFYTRFSQGHFDADFEEFYNIIFEKFSNVMKLSDDGKDILMKLSDDMDFISQREFLESMAAGNVSMETYEEIGEEIFGMKVPEKLEEKVMEDMNKSINDVILDAGLTKGELVDGVIKSFSK